MNIAAIYRAMWVKICGIKSAEDAEAVARSGANAIGLNFYPRSKRYVQPEVARKLRDVVHDRLEVVGVFVNSPLSEVQQIVRLAGLETVQFHGDETPEMLLEFHRTFPKTRIVRAFRIGDAGFEPAERALSTLADLGVPLQAVLIDAYRPGEYGGTGHQISFDLVNSWDYPSQNNLSLILAGGLKPDNVSEAVVAIRPWGVDTASGVEDSPGVKNHELVLSFVRNAQPQ